MGAYYMDSSALVKRYANETGSLWVRSLTDPQAGHDLFTAHITGIEVVAAIARKSRTREIALHEATAAISTFKSHLTTQYQIVLLTTAIVDHAMALAEQHTLRRFLKKNILIQEVGAGLIKMSYLGNAGWRSNRFSTACIAAFPSTMPFW